MCVVQNTRTWCGVNLQCEDEQLVPHRPPREAEQSQDQAAPPLLAPVSEPRRVWPAGPAPSQLLQTQRNVLLSRSWTGRGQHGRLGPLARQSPSSSANQRTRRHGSDTAQPRGTATPPPVTTGGARLSLHHQCPGTRRPG